MTLHLSEAILAGVKRPSAIPSAKRRAPGWAGWVALGAILIEWAGFYWDIARHGDIGRDTFFAVPHLVIVAAIAAGALAATARLRLWTDSVRARVVAEPGMALLMAGVLLTGVTLAVDNWWHAKFGVDVAVWSPPHLLLNLTFLIAALGVLAHFVTWNWSGWRLAALAGVFVAISSIDLAEFEFGYPHYPIAWSAAALGAVLGFGLLLTTSLSPLRWSASIAVAFALGLRLVTVGLNAAAGRSLAAPPIGLLAGAVVFDLVRRRPWRRTLPGPLQTLVGIGPAWVATFAVQAPWLRAIGKTWWTNSVLLPAFVLGGIAALGGALAGRTVGGRLRGLALAGDPVVDRAPRTRLFRGRGLAVPGAGAALGLAIALTAVPMFRTVAPFKLGTYRFDGRTLSVSVPGSIRADWVSTIGPLRPTGVFTPARQAPRPSTGTSSAGGTTYIQGTLRPILGQVLRNLDVSWLGGLTAHGSGFEGRPRGTGEWLLVWYLHGDEVWSGVVPRGTAGGVLLIHQLFSPPSSRSALLRTLGPLLVAVLVAVGVIVAVWIPEYAARSRKPAGHVF